MRINNKDLERLVNRLNKVFGFENPGYSTVGAFDLDWAYGGVKLVRYENEYGAISDVFRCGYTTKKDLYNRMNVFITGIEYKEKEMI